MNRITIAITLTCVVLFSFKVYARDSFLDIKEVTTSSGISAWLVEDHTLPIISIRFAFKGAGSSLDPREKQGRSLLLSNTLDEGAGELDSQSFQKELNDHSISLGFSSTRDDFYGSLTTLTKYKDKALELARLSLISPRFDEEPIERMKAANISRIKSSLSKPNWIAARLMNDIAFKDHPYSLNSGGTITTLKNLSAKDLIDFKNAYLTKDRLNIAVTGDITAKELEAVLDYIFGDLPESGKKSELEAIQIYNGGKTFLFEKDIPQTIIQIWQKGIDHKDPDYHTAQVMDFILGGSGFGSRLTEEVREKRGLTYGIYSYINQMEATDIYGVSTSTKNETAQEVLSIIKDEWHKIQDDNVTDKELADAKSYLIGSVPLSLSSTSQISKIVLNLLLDNLPKDYLDQREKAIQSVSKEDIKRLAKTLLTPDNFTIILVGKPENIKTTEILKTIPNVE
jgi:zinc protease